MAGIARDIPGVELDHEDGAEVLVLGWGSTWGAIKAGVRRVRARGERVAHAHLMHLNPFPADLGDVLGRYDRVLIPEMNLGQLAMLVRAEFLVDAARYNQVSGVPFRAADMEERIMQEIKS